MNGGGENCKKKLLKNLYQGMMKMEKLASKLLGKMNSGLLRNLEMHIREYFIEICLLFYDPPSTENTIPNNIVIVISLSLLNYKSLF